MYWKDVQYEQREHRTVFINTAAVLWKYKSIHVSIHWIKGDLGINCHSCTFKSPLLLMRHIEITMNTLTCLLLHPDWPHHFVETMHVWFGQWVLLCHIYCVMCSLLCINSLAIEVPFCKESYPGSEGRVEFNIAASSAPSIGPPDLSNEDYNSVGSVYSLPLSPSHIQTILSSYNSSMSENFYLKIISLLTHTMLILKLNTSCPLM